MKQLTVLAVSTIAHLRNAFTWDNYIVEPFAGLKVNILKKKCRDRRAQYLSAGLTGAFEAFDKKYLHQLAICFYEEECKAENLFEYYIFEYSYKSHGVTMNVRSKSGEIVYTAQNNLFQVREETIALLKACIVFSQSYTESLPSSYDLKVRLYYNEDAPKDYQPSGFDSGDNVDHLEPTLMATTKLGRVNTPFHSLSARFYMQDTVYSYEANPTQNPPAMSQIQEHNNAGFDTTNLTSDVQLLCPCNCYKNVNEMLLTCQYCNMQQHAVCFGVLPEDAQHVRKHCCATCYDENPKRTATDAKLASNINTQKRKSLALFRRILYNCLNLSEISAQTIVKLLDISKECAYKMINTLKRLDIIENVNPGSILPSKLNFEKLKGLINSYFNRIEKDVIVDRLLTEIMTDQNPQHDPIGDVLKPLEKAYLQNAVNLGRIVENSVKLNKTTCIEDVTMKQYTEAILSNDSINNDNDEELPLSGSHNPVKDIDQIGKKPIKRKTDGAEKKKIMMRFGSILSNDSVDDELPLSCSHKPVKDVDQIGKKKPFKRKATWNGSNTKNDKLQKNN